MVQRGSQAYRPVLIVMVLVVGLAVLLTRLPPRAGIPGPSSSMTASTVATGTGSPIPSPTATAAQPAVLLAVGDIGFCGGTADEAVGRLAASLPGTIALLGDNAYPDGSASDYAGCFDPTWGKLRARLRPAPGNHDYETRGAGGYFAYFGPGAGAPGQGWYSYDLGAWHVIALNSNCEAIGGCGSGSAQLRWLQADLAAHPADCTLAYWHHPRYSSGMHGSSTLTESLWAALASAGADVVLEGHDHDYERVAPTDGIRSFVVGTGGRSLYDWPGGPATFTEVRANDTYGLLELTLAPDSYAWRFLPAAGGSFTDSGAGPCH